MSAYVDDAAIVWKGKPRFHLCADSVDELHEFAQSIGINRCWFHRGSRYPHYDVTQVQRDAAIRAGAIPVDVKTQVRLARKREGRSRATTAGVQSHSH